MSGHLLTIQTVVLVAVSLAVLYPVIAYSRSVLHTEAIVALALSTFAFTVGSVVEQGLGRPVAAEGIYLLSAVVFGVAVWLFAREFVRPGETAFGGDTAAGGDETASRGGFAAASEEFDGGFANASEGEDGE